MSIHPMTKVTGVLDISNKSNDDRIGAMNLYRMGINYLEDNQVPDTVTAE